MTAPAPGFPVVLTCVVGLAVTAAAAAATAAVGRGAGPLCGPTCLERRLEDLESSRGMSEQSARAAARTLIRKQLALSPFNTGAWLRLTALETLAAGGRMEEAASAALAASYRYAPVSTEAALWRTRFVFDHWREADEEVRSSALREVRLLSWQDRESFLALQATIRDPAGGLAYRMVVNTAED